jgi:parvulin-like peptidyl-prolyl isomerase
VVRRLAVGLLLLLCSVFLGSVHGCGSNLPEGKVAQVGSNFVTEDQLSQLLTAYAATGKAPDKKEQPDAYQQFKQKCTQYLVTLEVMYQEAPGFGVAVTASDINTALDQIRRMFLGDEAKFKAAVAKQGMTMEQLTEAIRQNIWFEKMKAAVAASAAVREEEVKAYYNQHKTEYVLQETREVRHILISPFLDASGNTIPQAPTQTDWEAAESEAAKVRSEIMNGADFISEVEKYSDDDNSSSAGGALGVIVRGQTAPAFEQAVFKLQKGELSQPVRSPSGYHIIELLDITPAQQLAYDSVKEQIRSKLLQDRQTEAWNKWLNETQLRLGVIYRNGYAPPDAVTGMPAATTTSLDPLTGGTPTGETTTSTGSE